MRIFVPSSAALLTDRAGHGEGLIAWAILSGLAARGHELVVCAREADLAADPPFELIVAGRASRFESVEPFAYARWVRKMLAGLGGTRRFDVAHWIFPQSRNELILGPLGLPLLVGPHSLEWPSASRPLAAGDLVRVALAPIFQARRRRMLGGAKAVLVSTPAAVAILPRRVRSEARTVPFGVDAELFTATEAPPVSRVTFVGALRVEKGIRELVNAFALVQARLPTAELVIVGDGPERLWVEETARRCGLGDALRVVGAVAHERVPALLAESAVICLPSHGEPYGMAVLEAMAAGRAVVAVDAGGPRFLVDPVRGGRLVPPGDAAALGAALIELLCDPDGLRMMGAFNRERVDEALSLNAMLDALEALYAEVVR